MEDQAAFSPDGASLAFVSTQSGNADIYLLPFRPDTTQSMAAATNLTNDPGGDFRPDFSPDGSLLAFSTDRDTPVYGHPIFSFTRQREGEIYVMDRVRRQRPAAHERGGLGRLAGVVRGRPHDLFLFGAAARAAGTADEPDPGPRRRLSGSGRSSADGDEPARAHAGRHRGARARRDAGAAASPIKPARASRDWSIKSVAPDGRTTRTETDRRHRLLAAGLSPRAARWCATASDRRRRNAGSRGDSRRRRAARRGLSGGVPCPIAPSRFTRCGTRPASRRILTATRQP